MARSSDPTPGEVAASPAGVALSGILPPEAENGLPSIRDLLLDRPKIRRYAVVELVSTRTVIDHPQDGVDCAVPVVRFLSIEPIENPAALEVLTAIRDEARTARTGQGVLGVAQ